MKILLVEDDDLLRDGIDSALQTEGYACDAVSTAKKAKEYLLNGLYSLILLDVGLPDQTGIDLLKEWRKLMIDIPVIMITARDLLEDKIIGLDAGADDYLIKPFQLQELFARVRALIRRSEGKSTNIQHFKSLSLDFNRQILTKNDIPIDLTPSEFALISRLFLRTGEVVNRELLLEDLYSWQDNYSSNTLEVYIHNLRSKIGKDCIKTVRGIGYKLN